jgi:predicted nucleotidyltransferase
LKSGSRKTPISFRFDPHADLLPGGNSLNGYGFRKEYAMQREQVIQILSQHMEEIRQKFDVQSLSLFGSVARGESRPDSDLDILVTYSQVPGLFKYLDLKEYLEDLFHQPVDLVTMKALKKQLRDEILGEAVHVH